MANETEPSNTAMSTTPVISMLFSKFVYSLMADFLNPNKTLLILDFQNLKR